MLCSFRQEDSMKALPIQFDESIPAWEKAIYAFLAEKERRSGFSQIVL
jgi:hypothetical protein